MDVVEKKPLERFAALAPWYAQWKALPGIPGLRVVVPAVVVALLMAVMISTLLWLQKPAYRSLYSGLSDKESGQIVEVLQAQKIPFRLNETSGAIEVPAEQVHAARLKLATQGLPQGAGVGLEMLSQPQGLGVSQFLESARYQHALEVELARSIASLQPVQEARVHLAVPKASAFVRDQKKPSASVIVQLYPGRSLEPGQVAAIVHLIAASIPGMEASQVMVVDQRGNLLTREHDNVNGAMGISDDQFTYARRLENDYAQRIESLLMPIVGPGRVRAQVSADVDFTVVEQTQERFDPASQVLRSEQTNEERRAPGTLTGGIPGALSNQPPGPAILAPPPASTAAQTATNANSAAVPSAEAAAPALPPQDVSRQSTRNYEIDKTVSRISQPLGMVRRLSIAVLVDDWEKAGADGAVTKTPLTETDLARLTALVKESVGFNAARGDSINVVNQSFKNLDVGDGTREVPWWANPGLMDVMTKGFAMIVVLAVLLMIIRPLMRRLHTSSTARSAQMVSPLALPAGTEESGLARDRISLTRLAAPAAADDVASAQPYEIRRDAARTLAARHPEQVAQVMRDWMGQDG